MTVDHTSPAASSTTFAGEPGAPGTGTPPRRSRAVPIIVLSVGTLICSIVVAAIAILSLVGGSSVSAATVGEKLTQQYGAPVSCTENLKAEVGATIMCVGTDDQGAHQLRVTTTSVDGSDVRFSATPVG